jgi:cyanate permease
MKTPLTDKARRAYTFLSGLCLACSLVGLVGLYVHGQPSLLWLFAFSCGSIGAFLFGIPIRSECHLWPIAKVLELTKRKE